MSEAESTFVEFMHRIRAGDDAAATELVNRYESVIRREIRFGIEDAQLSRLFESVDVCQSVLASFFTRMSLGQFDIDCPEKLVGLLIRMARNKLISHYRSERRQRRDYRRTVALDTAAIPQPQAESPGAALEVQELLQKVTDALTAEERQIIELRREGLSWQHIAERMTGTAQSRRMQLSRTLERIGQQLGMDD
ncbi:MAG: sigma-70 family RNA polymerase sigma factor [Planctomycetaceae bacterium]|nr:sigma-70 family RNA polymerase sigma factor [Planctomycetaceae bacterium]